MRGAMRERGFTYLWVMMTVGLVGLSLLAAAELASTALRRDQERQLIFIGRQFRTAIRQYAIAHGQQYPDTLQTLLRDPDYPGVKRYLRRVYVDPITGKADWGLIRVGGRIVGVHSLSTAAPIQVDNFEPAEAGFKDKQQYAQWSFTYPANLVVPDDDSPIRGLQPSNMAGLQASATAAVSNAMSTSVSTNGALTQTTIGASNAGAMSSSSSVRGQW